MQEPYQVIGPPQGHPDFSSSFAPYTAYSEQQDTIQFQATTTVPDNLNTLFIASTVLSAGQTTITTSSTSGQVRAGAILSRNGEVLAADLGSGAAASNVGTLGGSLVGTLPNPTLASTGATSGTYINPVTITVDEDGRVSDIANVSNWNVPGNVTAGGTIVASGTISGAAATAAGNMVPYSQAFQLLSGTPPSSITLGNTLKTVAQYSLSAATTITLEPGSVQGQEITVFGGAYALTLQPNVTSGYPGFYYPDQSSNYSWTIPAGASVQGIKLVWDGDNWRARTFGQQVVAPATQDNAAVQLAQLQQYGGGNFQGWGGDLTADTTLTSSDWGYAFQLGASGATITLPTTNGNVGQALWFYSQFATGSCTINVTGSGQFIFAPTCGLGSTNTSMVVNAGEWVCLLSREEEIDVIAGSWLNNHQTTQPVEFYDEVIVGAATQDNAAVNLGQFPASLSLSGYQKLPNGLIIQWGSYLAAAADTLYDVTLPIAFPNATAVVLVTPYNNSTAVSAAQGYFVNTSTIGLVSSAASITLNYIAIGH
jgi:hypothetical protein